MDLWIIFLLQIRRLVREFYLLSIKLSQLSKIRSESFLGVIVIDTLKQEI